LRGGVGAACCVPAGRSRPLRGLRRLGCGLAAVPLVAVSLACSSQRRCSVLHSPMSRLGGAAVSRGASPMDVRCWGASSGCCQRGLGHIFCTSRSPVGFHLWPSGGFGLCCFVCRWPFLLGVVWVVLVGLFGLGWYCAVCVFCFCVVFLFSFYRRHLSLALFILVPRRRTLLCSSTPLLRSFSDLVPVSL